jgi:hypothetical protein
LDEPRARWAWVSDPAHSGPPAPRLHHIVAQGRRSLLFLTASQQDNMNLDFSKLHFIHWVFIAGFSFIGLICLVISASQFKREDIPPNNKSWIKRSIISGVMAGGFCCSLFFVWGVFLWSETNNFISMYFVIVPLFCLAPPLIIIMFGTSLLHFWYGSKTEDFIKSIAVSEMKKKQ